MDAMQREALQTTWKSTKKNPPQITNVISVIKITNQKQYCSDTREWTVQNIWHQIILPELFKFCIFCTVCYEIIIVIEIWNCHCDWNMKSLLSLNYWWLSLWNTSIKWIKTYHTWQLAISAHEMEATFLKFNSFRSIHYINVKYNANVYRDLQGLCGGFLQYLQGKPCNIYRFSLQPPCNL